MDEEINWDWNTPKESYNFFPFVEDDYVKEEQPNTPPPSPQSPNHDHNRGNPSEAHSSTSTPPRTRRLQEIYDETKDVTQASNDVNIFCLLRDCDSKFSRSIT